MQLRKLANALGPLAASRASWAPARTTEVGCGVLIGLAFVWNLSTVMPGFALPGALDALGELTTVEQDWSVFSKPRPESIWYVFKARLADGHEIDLNTGKPAQLSEPPDIAAHIGGRRWHVYVNSLRSEGIDLLFPAFVNDRCFAWNRSHHGTERAEEVEIVAMHRPTRPWSAAAQGVVSEAMVQAESLGRGKCP